MNKKEICLNNDTFAYYSGFAGLELKEIEHGINDYIYCVSGAWCGSPSYHKLKVYYDPEGTGKDHIKLHGVKVPLDECIRVNI